MAGIYFTTSLMTMFISNTVTAVLMAPIALQSAIQIGVSPVPFLFAVTVAASMCFASPFSTPPNALVMPAGQYTFMDYIKVGAPVADYYGSGDGICVAVAVSFLAKYMTTSLCCNIGRGLRGITRTMQIEFLKFA